MNVTPTAPHRALRHADFPTLTEALDYAATGETGINFHDLRGKLTLALPYVELRAQALDLARGLLAAGLAPGDRVGLVADTTPDFVRAFFACQYAGVAPVPMPLPAPLGGREAYVAQIARMLGAAAAEAVVVSEEFEAWLTQAAAAAGVPRVLKLNDLPAGAEAALPAVGPDQTSYLQFSSGSTRAPTGVVVTHRALMANAVAFTRDGLQVTPADRAVSWLPLYHDMGLIGFLIGPVTSQMSLDLLPTAAFVRRPLLWLDLITRHGGSVTYSPTFGYDLCARRADAAGEVDLSTWRIAGVGGDMVRPGPLETFADCFSAAGFRREAFVASYGMAEATLALTMAPLGKGLSADVVDVDRMEQDGVVVSAGEAVERRRSFVRCGPILPGHELQVRDETGAVLGEGQVGRIFVRGPSLMREYFRQPEATAAVLSADGWLDTGDLGYLADGEIAPTGRSKDLILLNGRNVWPQDLEWTAESGVDGLRSGDVAAISQGEETEERVVLLVQCRSSDQEVRQRITDDVAALMRARHGLDAEVRLVGPRALPQTSSGKLSRSKARTLFESGAFDLVGS
ncbi:MAG TPA: fatty acyl-AMP ligase [Phenylobacterium sp.]|uniref:fatty acyl-AMP ligase n=1 Tax=Phenylobacterium sp. TaxID=1871053 RepID=UPI002B49921C|nr:fatty acyl-AMP ligase [Phenylobacterium sp.]HKR89700.1 fatty acyl-AMP ligase [Phenylobacterium sp.]